MDWIYVVLIYWVICAAVILAIRKMRSSMSRPKSRQHKPAWVGVLFSPIAVPALLVLAPYMITKNWEVVEAWLLDYITKVAQE